MLGEDGCDFVLGVRITSVSERIVVKKNGSPDPEEGNMKLLGQALKVKLVGPASTMLGQASVGGIAFSGLSFGKYLNQLDYIFYFNQR